MTGAVGHRAAQSCARAEFTSGPWIVDGEGDVCSPHEDGAYLLAETYTPLAGSREANARLIAAAPDLYAALIESIRFMNKYVCGVDMSRIDRLTDAAIEKALRGTSGFVEHIADEARLRVAMAIKDADQAEAGYMGMADAAIAAARSPEAGEPQA